jgi:hypothetical protein
LIFDYQAKEPKADLTSLLSAVSLDFLDPPNQMPTVPVIDRSAVDSGRWIAVSLSL